MPDNAWRRKAEALARLAEDQRGKPEGDLAREKLAEILAKHPEAREYAPVKEVIERDITIGHVFWMRRQGVSTEGSWTGRNLAEAIALMEADYKQRIADAKARRLSAEIARLEAELEAMAAPDLVITAAKATRTPTADGYDEHLDDVKIYAKK